LVRGDLEKIYDGDYKFEFGRASVIKPGKDAAIFAVGAMVEKALEGAKLLAREGIDAAVINMATIKPLDTDTLLDFAKKTKAVVTIEDHSIHGGLGGAVAEFLSQNHPTRMKIIGVEDKFGRSGSIEELYSYYGLTAQRAADEVRKLIS
jgi:transketolase